MKSYWFDAASGVIAEVVRKLPKDADKRTILLAVDSAYPFGSRDRWPYKKWLEARTFCLGRIYPKLFPPKVKNHEDAATPGLS